MKIIEYKPDEMSEKLKEETEKLFPEAVVKRIAYYDDLFKHDNIHVLMQQKGRFRTKNRLALNIDLMSGQLTLYDRNLLEQTKKIATIMEEQRSRAVEIYIMNP
jgi:hypothetical protein